MKVSSTKQAKDLFSEKPDASSFGSDRAGSLPFQKAADIFLPTHDTSIIIVDSDWASLAALASEVGRHAARMAFMAATPDALVPSVLHHDPARDGIEPDVFRQGPAR